MPRSGLNRLLLLLLLAGCGGQSPAPKAQRKATGDDAVPLPTTLPQDGGAASAAVPVRPTLPVVKWRGAYKASDRISEFRPCGSRDTYRIVGPADQLRVLRESVRFSSMWVGRPMYAVLRGEVLPDSSAPEAAPGDEASGPELPRFRLRHVDTVRTLDRDDCAAARLPWP